jgi:uncharacterized damage-inducible protein DinB
MTSEAEFLDYSCRKLEQLTERVEGCVALLTPEQVWARGGEAQNAIGNLLLHLTGNVRQWILSGVGGVAIARDRNSEFSARGGVAPAELSNTLREAVEAALHVIRTLRPQRLIERTTIQGHDVTSLEAIYHVVEHFSGHTGQIILLTKAYTNRALDFYSYLSQPGATSGKTP